MAYTILHAGGKFGGGGYKMAGGLHGVGASVVNALSVWLKLTSCDGSEIHYQEFVRGHYDEEMKVIGQTDRTGTEVIFKPDGEIFEDTHFDYETLETRLREQAFLNAGLRIILRDSRDPENIREDNMYYEGGIRSFVEHIHARKKVDVVHPDVIYLSRVEENRTAEIALQYNSDFNELVLSFANNIHTVEGGFHEVGFKTALLSASSCRNANLKARPKASLAMWKPVPWWKGWSMSSLPTIWKKIRRSPVRSLIKRSWRSGRATRRKRPGN